MYVLCHIILCSFGDFHIFFWQCSRCSNHFVLISSTMIARHHLIIVSWHEMFVWKITGNVAVGNLSKMLPFVLQEIEKQPKRQYLLLHSLKEVRIYDTVHQISWILVFHSIMIILLSRAAFNMADTYTLNVMYLKSCICNWLIDISVWHIASC